MNLIKASCIYCPIIINAIYTLYSNYIILFLNISIMDMIGYFQGVLINRIGVLIISQRDKSVFNLSNFLFLNTFRPRNMLFFLI